MTAERTETVVPPEIAALVDATIRAATAHGEHTTSATECSLRDCRAKLDAAIAALAGETATLRSAALRALYRVQEWSPRHVRDAAWGIGPVNTDAGAAYNALRRAAGITVTLRSDGHPEFHTAHRISR